MVTRRIRSIAVAALIAIAGCGRTADTWRVAALDSYQLFSVAPASGAKTAPIDLRAVWDEHIFFLSDRQLEKQGRAYPDISIADSSELGLFLAIPHGLEYRDDGPVVLAEVATGKAIATFPLDDARTPTTFATPDVRAIPASAASATTLDHFGNTVLLESNASRVTIGIWDREHVEAPPVVLARMDYGGHGANHGALVDGGRRALWWVGDASPVTVYDSADGRVIGRLQLDGEIRAFARDASGAHAVFAVGRSLVVIDPRTATIVARVPDVLSPARNPDSAEDVTLFWYRVGAE